MYPHRIRLRGPWECEPLARASVQTAGPLPPPGRMILPCRWGEGGLGDFAGRVRFRRRFGFPGRIDSYERVWLTFAGVEGTAEVGLNGQLLGRREGAEGPFEFEVTSLLSHRNELTVEVEAAGGRGGLWGEVALEIRCTAFLRDVRAWVEPAEESARLHLAGEVAGTCERPLELYALLDGSTIIYATLEAAPAGRPFHFCSEALDPQRWRVGEEDRPHLVRVELVNGAVVWYTVEQTLWIRAR